jgi:hypothetical protein
MNATAHRLWSLGHGQRRPDADRAPVPAPVLDTAQLHRIRNGVRAVLALGVAASVAGNVLHAQPTLVGRAIAAWSPLALLLAVELISRVPVHKLILSILRMLSTAAIAGIAAWVSYGHMVSVAQHHGENSTSAHLLPLSVDGLVVVASVSLVEIAARLHHATTTAVVVQEAPADDTSEAAPQASAAVPAPGYRVDAEAHVEPVNASDNDTQETPTPTPAPRTATQRTTSRTAGTSTATKVARLRRQHPDWTHARIAEKAGCTERTVRRHLNTPPPDAAAVTDVAA